MSLILTAATVLAAPGARLDLLSPDGEVVASAALDPFIRGALQLTLTWTAEGPLEARFTGDRHSSIVIDHFPTGD